MAYAVKIHVSADQAVAHEFAVFVGCLFGPSPSHHPPYSPLLCQSGNAEVIGHEHKARRLLGVIGNLRLPECRIPGVYLQMLEDW